MVRGRGTGTGTGHHIYKKGMEMQETQASGADQRKAAAAKDGRAGKENGGD